jgi:hypothetical protein
VPFLDNIVWGGSLQIKYATYCIHPLKIPEFSSAKKTLLEKQYELNTQITYQG